MDALLRESRKEKIAYKLEALKCLGEVLEKFSIDKFTEVFSILSPILIKVQTEDSTYLTFSFQVATSWRLLLSADNFANCLEEMSVLILIQAI